MSNLYQRLPKTMYRPPAPTRFELEVGGAEKQNLGNGFFRYLWVPALIGNTPIRISLSEYLDFR
jgi:hypothetical protein